MRITLLCKVVDNYGDIGFVYRLSRNLAERNPVLEITLVVSNLESFSAMAPGIKNVPVQKFRGWDILDWNAKNDCMDFFKENPSTVILECFQCGRPEWLDEILFDKGRTQTVQIVNVEYLTAEKWADDFHLLKSGTRSSLVKKINFMPGFTKKTGGLVLDMDFMESLSDRKSAIKKLVSCVEEKSGSGPAKMIAEMFGDGGEKNFFNVTVFAYQKNLDPVVFALAEFQRQQKKLDPDFTLNVFAAPGLSFECFEKSWNKFDRPFSMVPLPYLSQTAWDALLVLCDFNFIRGEDSFSRACLSGKAFMWNAYRQDEEFQLVKVRAFVDLTEKFFMEENCSEAFEDYRDAMMVYNKSPDAAPCPDAIDAATGCDMEKDEGKAILHVLENFSRQRKTFQNFSKSLISNGNLTENLEHLIFGTNQRLGS